MQVYTIEISVCGTGANGETADVWSARGEIKGRSLNAVIRRAWSQVFGSYLDESRIRGSVVYHNKYRDMPVLRVVAK